MPKLNATLSVKNNIRLVRRNLDNLRTSLHRIGKQRVTEAGAEIIRRMAKPGKKIKYPVNWDSAKQRIAVIIMIMRKQGSLPYVRTGTHERGWKSQITTKGVKVYNNARGSKYVYGTMRSKKQSNIHVGRWAILREVYDAVIVDLPKKVKESLRQVPKAR